MDPDWHIKSDDLGERAVSAARFFEEVRVQFALQELLEEFPVLLEHHLRSDLRRRVAASGLRSLRGDFHVQTIRRYLEEAPDGVFAIDRHVPPDLGDDRDLLLQAFERAERGPA